MKSEGKGFRCPKRHNAFMLWENKDEQGGKFFIIECIDCRTKGKLAIRLGHGRELPVELFVDWEYEKATSMQ